MKKGIHPELHEVIATCACGAQYKVLSTKEKITLEVCSACHPFYTGKRTNIIDTEGRVERFNRRYSKK
ncbi:50S ribosomal protein L31 [Mesoaciditoga lauensis]|uniref:50S ribosomal protein L31 n=1 Tax=Mesoaciditoga lauensis TaxID=1495039 RepID=UPI00055D4FB9|nr:50S ribosomal protein L31 [Mesoaciditoga lauensis]